MKGHGVELGWADAVLRPAAIIARVGPRQIPTDLREQWLQRWAAYVNHWGYPPPPGWESWDADAMYRAISEARRRFPRIRQRE